MRPFQLRPIHDLPITVLDPPRQVWMPLETMTPVVQPGDAVEQGQLIAVSANGAPWDRRCHASLEGKVITVDEIPDARGDRARYLRVEGQTISRAPADQANLDSMGKQQILDAVRQAGVVGMGGAMFPTYAKFLNVGTIDWVLVNGCESEPYLSCDHRVLVEHRSDVECGMRIAMRAVGAVAGTIVSGEKRYADGYEPLLIHRVLGREIPAGGFARDVGVVVINVQTARALHDAVCGRRPLIERVLSVAGGAVARPGNYVVPIGTKVGHVLDVCGVDRQRAAAILAGGPMMGQVVDAHQVITAGTGGILALTAGEIAAKKAFDPCINCGQCQEVCPLSLAVVPLIRRPSTAVLRCMECGGCEYVCPSQRPLVALLRKAKDVLESTL